MTEILIGPPGTGKTTSLLNILDEELAAGTPPDRIGYVSFTRKAAEEAVTRACDRFKLSRSDFPWFRTLHSLCFRMLGMTRREVLEGTRMREFASYARVRITGRWSEDGTMVGFETGDRIIFMENLARIRGVPLRSVYDLDDDGLPWREVERVVSALRVFKTQHGYMDYTDMLSTFVSMNSGPPLDVLLVDEAQDLSPLQWRVVEVLRRGVRRVVVAGDDDQAIYRWAGADVDALIDLEGTSRVLPQSFRCPPAIQSLAGGIVGRIGRRRPKEWRAREGSEGTVESVVGLGELDLGGEDVLILARNDYILKEQFEPELQRRGILYERHGSPSIPQAVLRAILDWEALRRGEVLEREAVLAIVEHMSAGRGVRRGSKKLPEYAEGQPLSLETLERDGVLMTREPWFAALDRLPISQTSYIRTALAAGEKPRARPRVRLSTIHGAKGGEAAHVVLSREIAARTHREMELSPEDEMRVWYVAVTRAKERLTLVDATTPRSCPWL